MALGSNVENKGSDNTKKFNYKLKEKSKKSLENSNEICENNNTEAELVNGTSRQTRTIIIQHRTLGLSNFEDRSVVALNENGISDSEATGEKAVIRALDKCNIEPDSEVIFVQDIGFMIKIQSPGSETFEIQVSSMELVQEIHQLLMDREDTCHRTCFSLQLDGITLDNFAELKSIEGLKDGSKIKVVEEPYTVREARIHIRHIRDLLKSIDPSDAYNGVECSSLTFLNSVTQGDLLEKRKNRGDSVDCSPPDYIMPLSKERPLLPLHPLQPKDQKGSSQCVKILTTSAWNPPPGFRKMHGDLMYLYVITMEDKHFHITACTKGFFVNQSTEEHFDPTPSEPHHLCHSLIELLNQLSPTFKRNFGILQKKRTQRHPFERVATPYQVYSWVTPYIDHTMDAIRAEDAFSSKLGYEEHIPGQTRDWNEELQTTRELPRSNLPERLLRERAIFKVHSDFVAAASRGAMAVIDGNVMAINPGEDAKMQMFIWNNIFFSLGFDVKDHYKELGGDAAAFVAPKNDLQGVRVYGAVDLEGLYTLGTVVVDYRGYRVTAQSIIPGILEREQEQSVVYGSIDFGKTIITHEKYIELLSKAAEHFKLLPHKVVNDKGEEVELYSSVECKGIIGNDGRHYILDLLRTTPPDVNFLKLEEEDLSDEMKAFGFPIEHKHKLCILRQELIDSFVESRYAKFIKYAALLYQRRNIKQAIENKENDDDMENTIALNECNLHADEAKKIVEKITTTIKEDGEDVDAMTKDIIKTALTKVGSLMPYEFDIRFNPDVYSPGVRHADPDSEQFAKQKKLVKDAAKHVVKSQIPLFISDCLDHLSTPMDGTALSELLHTRGINIRYLGKVANMLLKIKPLDYVHSICVSELIIRATKHIFSIYLQNTEMMSLASAVSHFLNCFLTSNAVPHPQTSMDDLHSKYAKRRSKRKGRINRLMAVDNNEWANLTPKLLWAKIKGEIKSYWDWDLQTDSVESTCEYYSLQRISLLRSFCLKNGVQILLREYSFDTKNKLTFYEDDIVNMFPVVKHVKPKQATDAFSFYSAGQAKIAQGFLKQGLDLVSEALNLLNNVYGAMHSEISQCLRTLARLSYLIGDYPEALSYQQKAVLMSERVNGIDHQTTIIEYVHLGIYCFANSSVSVALKLLYRARYLCLLLYGENHPQIAVIDSNISVILHAVGEHELSLRFLEKALALNLKYQGTKSMKTAISYHLIARAQSCIGDFRSALNNEKEAYTIYKSVVGEDHERTRSSSEFLRHLTHQAVMLQKKMNEIYNGKTTISLPPIHVQSPTLSLILDMLNSINTIVPPLQSEREAEIEYRNDILRNTIMKDLDFTDD